MFNIDNIPLSKFAFIFLIIAIISGGEAISFLSCQVQYNLKNNIYFKHFMGLLLHRPKRKMRQTY